MGLFFAKKPIWGVAAIGIKFLSEPLAYFGANPSNLEGVRD